MTRLTDREKQARYLERNRTQINERRRANYRADRDRQTEIKRVRRLNPEVKAAEHATQKRYRDRRTIEQLKARAEYNRQWCLDNPTLVRANNRKRRALRMGAPSEPYTDQIILDIYGTVCYLCEAEIDLAAPRRAGLDGWELGLHLDHLIPLVLGGTDLIENIRPTHGKCNLAKSTSLC